MKIKSRNSLIAIILLFVLLVSLRYAQAKEPIFLTPPNYIPYYPLIAEYSGCPILDLNGEWHYQIGEEGSRSTVNIPSSWENFTGKVKFRRHFRVDKEFQGGYFRLVALNVSRRCVIFLNDELVGSYDGPLLEVVLPEKLLVYDHNNILEIDVDNALDHSKTIPLRNGLISPRNYGGITGDIFITMQHRPAIDEFKALAFLTNKSDSGVVRITGKFIKSPHLTALPCLYCQISDFSGKIVASMIKDYGEAEDFAFDLMVPRPLLWSSFNPKLYNLQLWLEDAEGRINVHRRQIGFRKFIAGVKFRLNNDEVQLRGLSYYCENQYGLTLSPQQYITDLNAIKECGANTVLLPTVVSPYLLQLCDSLGFLVLQASGIEGAPNSLLQNEVFSLTMKERLRQMSSISECHPSVVGWVIGRKMAPGFEKVIPPWPEGIQDYRPVFGEIANKPNFLYKLEDGQIDSSTSIVSDISAVICSENSQSETRQLDDIFRQLLRWKGFSGIILGSYADWKIDGNILYQGLCRERNFFLGGLVKWDRQSRLVYRTLQQGWHSYAPKKPASTPDDQSFEFPIFGLAIIAFILLYIRHNNIFRQKLKRAFAHSHGFFQDIRNGRFIGKSQTAFVGLVTAIVVALIVASLLYHYRCSSAFDYLLRHLLQGDGLDYNLIQIIWQPLLAILYVFIFALFSIIILTLAFKSASQLLGKRLPYGQSLVFILWSWAGFIWFSPATLLFYRALEMPLLRTVVLLGFLCFLLWGYFRSVNALKVVSTGGFFRAFIAMSTVHLLLLGIIVLFLHYYCGLFYYTDYFLKAII